MITWTVTDAAGQMASCDQNIWVSDNEAPTLVCPPDLSVDVDAGECFATLVQADLGDPTPADNCTISGTPMIIAGFPPGGEFPTGRTTIVWQITDDAGLVAECNQNVYVRNVPTIDCPPSIEQIGDCDGLSTVDTKVNADGCRPPVNITCTYEDENGVDQGAFESGVTELAPGMYTIICTATDANNNTAECQIPVWIKEPPKLTLTAGPDCVGPGDSVFLQVHMSDLMDVGIPVSGFEATLEYNTQMFLFVGGDYTDDPFGLHLIDPIIETPPGSGTIRMAAGINSLDNPPQLPTLDDALLATLEFVAIGGSCDTDKFWFATGGQPTQLAGGIDSHEILRQERPNGIRHPQQRRERVLEHQDIEPRSYDKLSAHTHLGAGHPLE